MFLSPSSIHFTSCTGHLSIEDITRERDIIEASRHFVQNMDRARLQVAEKDGHYFTLNNTRLLVFRRLEEEGRCNRVRVDCVPLNAIPQGIRMMMVAPTFKTNVNTTDAVSGNIVELHRGLTAELNVASCQKTFTFHRNSQPGRSGIKEQKMTIYNGVSFDNRSIPGAPICQVSLLFNLRQVFGNRHIR